MFIIADELQPGMNGRGKRFQTTSSDVSTTSRAFTLLGGAFNPFEKYARQNGFIFPNFRGEEKTNWNHHPALVSTNPLSLLFSSRWSNQQVRDLVACNSFGRDSTTLRETNILALENQWLEDDFSFCGPASRSWFFVFVGLFQYPNSQVDDYTMPCPVQTLQNVATRLGNFAFESSLKSGLPWSIHGWDHQRDKN